MKLTHYLVIFSVLAFLFSCTSDPSSKLSTLVKTNSTGGFDEILVVANSADLNNYLKEPINKTLRASYDVLPQYEPIFTSRTIAFDDFDRLFQHFRTIIFLVDLSENTAITDFVVKNLGEENTAKALNDDKFYYAMKKNVWAEPQLVIFVFAANKNKLKARVENGFGKIVEIAQQNELEKYKNNAYFKGLNTQLTNRLKTKYNIKLDIPKDYVAAIENDHFMWIRKAEPEKSKNIMISIRDSIVPLNVKTIIDWRDQLGKDYITSDVKGSYMKSDTILPFQVSQQQINGLWAEEVRGLWKMKGDFMGGPFMTYVFEDKKNNRQILIDGFVHAPGDKKKPEIRTLKAILTSFGVTD